jgi:tetratricopeptide (TPR) repeat protein
MATKEQLLGVIRYGHDEMLRFIARLSDDDRNTIGEGDQWTVRDMLSHVIESMRLGARRLAVYVRGEEQEEYGDNDQRNAHMVADYRRLAWDEVYASLQAAQPEMEALLDLMSDDELNDPQRYERFQGRPAWRSIASNALTHPLAFHIRPWYIAQGDVDYATQQAEEEVRLLLELGDMPDWHGNVYYNLACHHALAGQKEAAMQRLEEALRLAPNMAEYARQDSDFASLHGAPEFEALTTGQVSPG